MFLEEILHDPGCLIFAGLVILIKYGHLQALMEEYRHGSGISLFNGFGQLGWNSLSKQGQQDQCWQDENCY